MKLIFLVICLGLIAGCSSTPNPDPKATYAAYNQVKTGMSRGQVYALLGEPRSVRPEGDFAHCRVATWSIPHDTTGLGHWTVTFANDTATTVSTIHGTLSN